MRFLSILALTGSAMSAKLNFTMSVNPPPQPGSPFLVTWTPPPPPENRSVEVLINYFDGDGPVLLYNDILGFAPIDGGNYIWNVPSDLCGTHSFGLAFDFRRPLIYGQPFKIPCSA